MLNNLIRFDKSFPFFSMSVYDPIAHTVWLKGMQSRYTSPFFEMWQHIKYKLLGKEVGKVFVIIEEVGCTCKSSFHQVSFMRCVHEKQAHEIADNFNRSMQMMWAYRSEHNFLSRILPPNALFSNTHKATGAPQFYVKEFPTALDGAKYMLKLTTTRRAMYLEGGGGGMPFPQGMDMGDGNSEVSIQDMGNALVMRRVTTRTQHVGHKPGWGTAAAAKKDDPTN